MPTFPRHGKISKIKEHSGRITLTSFPFDVPIQIFYQHAKSKPTSTYSETIYSIDFGNGKLLINPATPAKPEAVEFDGLTVQYEVVGEDFKTTFPNPR